MFENIPGYVCKATVGQKVKVLLFIFPNKGRFRDDIIQTLNPNKAQTR